MTTREHISSGTVWEERYGYARAVRVGNRIEVAGTVAADHHGNVVGAGDPYAQTKFIFQKIESALHDLGAELHNVVRTRMYLTDIAHLDAVGRAHGECFREIRPASTALQVAALVDPAYLVEIEVTAVI